MNTAANSSMTPQNALHLLRMTAAAVATQAQLHFSLVRVELAAEKSRWMKLLATAALGLMCLLCVMLFAGALVIAISWDTPYRLLAIALLVLIYALGVIMAWHQANALMALGLKSFTATRDELAADLALFRSQQ